MSRLRVACVTVMLLAAPAGVSGQSLFARGGLGVPVEPIGARAKGMASLGIGLFGSSLSPVDPAAGLEVVPMLTVTLQPTWGDWSAADQSGDLQGQRFPLVGAGYATGAGGMVSVTLGSYMDQRWAVEAPDTIPLAGEDRAVTDAFESDGGISTIRLGYAHRITPQLVLAGNVGAMSGQVTRTFSRQFDTTGVSIGVDDFEAQGRWRWIGPAAAVGVRWDPAELVRVSASVNWYGTLEAQPQDSTPGPTFEFDLPLELRVGASGSLTPDLALSASASYADWTATEQSLAADSLPPGDAAATAVGFGAGLEWSGLALGGKSFPLRFGYKRQQLPFKFEGDTPIESVLAGGLGFNLAQAEGIILARMDLALERGSRSGGSLTERFWRMSLSFRAAGL